MKITKTAQYHDATNSRFYLQFSWYFPWNASKRLSTTMLQMTCSISIFPWYFPWISPKQLSTMMLQMTRVISFFHGMSHELHQNGSVPRSYKWQRLSQFFMVIPMEFTKAAQYHNATNDARYLFFMVFSMQSTNTAQYHDATNNTRYLIFHDISHEIHQNGSVPRCYR